MNELCKKVDNIQQGKDSTETSEQEESVIMLSENTEVGAENLFNEKELLVFPGTFSYSAAAATNVENHQNKGEVDKYKSRNGSKNFQNHQSQPVNKSTDKPIKTIISRRPTASETLLIDDFVLSGIHKKGLNKNVECHLISGATAEILMDKIQTFDLKCFESFENIIIYFALTGFSSQFNKNSQRKKQ